MDDATLDAAIRAAFKANDGEALYALSKAHNATKECSHENPWLHRVGDVARARGSVRVLRCITCGGKLMLRAQRGKAAVAPGLSIDLTLDEQRRHVDGSASNDG